MVTNTSSGLSVGDARRLTLTLTSTAGAATDSDVTLIWQTPSGVVTSIVSTSTTTTSTALPSDAVIHSTTGVYYADVLSTEAGDYLYHWRSTGVVNASTDGRWAVRPALAST